MLRFVKKTESPLIKLRIGTHETLAAHIWPNALPVLAQRFPQTMIVLTSGRVDALVEALLRDELDLIFSVEPRSRAELKIRPIYSGSLEFYVGSKWAPLSRAKSLRVVALDDIRNQNIFTDTKAHTQQGMSIPNALAATGLSNIGQFEVASFEAAIKLAAMNLGIAVIPDKNARQAVLDRRLKLLNISGLRSKEKLQYQVCLTSLSGSSNNDLYDQFGELLSSVCDGDFTELG